MARSLVAYFSATGTTRRMAEAVAKAAGADLEAIEPAVPYTSADLDWQNKKSRSTIEMNDPACRVDLAAEPGDLSAYDTVYLGFPVWWYVAPRIIDTWVEKADLAGKKVVVWATSGGSGLGRSTAELAKLAPKAEWVDGAVLHSTGDLKKLGL